jgi:hypothetical protein
VTVGFVAPPPGTRMCEYPVVYGPSGKPETPRACKRAAKGTSSYCAIHERAALRAPIIKVHHGGFCIWCSQPGRAYVCDGVTVTLCGRHERALCRTLQRSMRDT